MAVFGNFTSITGLSVGNVASLIALAIFIVKFVCPHAIVFVLGGSLGDSNTAATWSTAGRLLHNTYWPEVLRGDTSMRHNVGMGTRIISMFLPLTSLLVALAGIITPLGLYEGVWQAPTTVMPFQYFRDLSTFGQGTPNRSGLGFNRRCGFSQYRPCPFSSGTVSYKQDADGSTDITFSGGTYDIKVPQILEDTYSSGTVDNSTVSNFFDIQWRQYATSTDTHANNGSAYLVGSLRQMQTMALNDAWETIEGLIVDTKKGAIGFRNHTLPTNVQQSVSWTEDILFVEPESACADTNLTMDFIVTTNGSVQNLVLTDRGGFANLNHTYPTSYFDDAQGDISLPFRAYKAAWMSNAWSMLYWNVTNPHDEATGKKAFSYVDSFVGKQFALRNDNRTGVFNSLQVDSTWEKYLGISGSSGGLLHTGMDNNPFNLTSKDFGNISLICHGAGGGDTANISNPFVSCGLMYGAAQRNTPGSPLIFEEGSNWTLPLYACATATKASIKTVTFNQTEILSLRGLSIVNIQDKTYPDPSQQPLWAVENSGFNNSDIQPLWGIVTPGADAHVSMSLRRGPSLYLPGYDDSLATLSTSKLTTDNLPGSRFHLAAAATTYGVSWDGRGSTGIDYTGYSNLAMWNLWQQLSASAANASQILNLIWTDAAASYVVGTKGTLGQGNAGQAIPITVQPLVARVSYHWPYGIPAFLVALLFLACLCAALVAGIMGRSSFGTMRRHIAQTSAGRIFTVFLDPHTSDFAMSGKQWNRSVGGRVVNLGDPAGPGGSDGVTKVEVEPALKGMDPPGRSSDGSQMLLRPWKEEARA